MTRAPRAALGNRALVAALIAAAALSLGLAVQIRDGMISPFALVWLTAAIVLMLVSLFAPRLPAIEFRGDVIVALVLAVSLIVQFVVLFNSPPMAFGVMTPGWNATFLVGLGAAALATIAIVATPRVTAFPIVVLIAAFLTVGVVIIHTSPSPPIDVFVFQQQSSDALLHGRNPYTESFPDIYGGASGAYGPGLSVGGRLMFGFPYPPLSLLLALPGYAFLADYRYAQLVAMAAAAIFMIAIGRSQVSALAAAVFLFTPRSFFVLEQGWTDPFCVLLASATLLSIVRWPRAWPYVLGLAIAVKQYMILALPAVLLVMDTTTVDWRRARSVLMRACLVALGVTLPFALVNPSAFVESVVTLQFFQPFRRDALSYLVAIAGADGPAPGSIWTLVAGLVGLALAMWRAPRTVSGVAIVLAVASVSIFAFSKQGFCNYYYFTIGMLCLAVAATNARGLTPNSARNA